MKKLKRIIFLLFKGIITVVMLAALTVIGINVFVVASTWGDILEVDEANNFDADCIMVLGAAVWGDKPSHMLEDRLSFGVDLYKNGASDRLLMSGDHGTKYYDEVGTMKNYAIKNGVASKYIFMDHAGFSTYDSVYRAKEIFKVKRIIIVTQKYHLHRAVFLAKSMGMEVVGVASDPRSYQGQWGREFREVLARIKDVYYSVKKPLPKKMGKAIPITGNGNSTNN